MIRESWNLQSHEQYMEEFMTLDCLTYFNKLDAGTKWKLRSHGMYDEKKAEQIEAVKDFKANDLILTREKLEQINQGKEHGREQRSRTDGSRNPSGASETKKGPR